jgi:hypothetical protein
MDPTDPDPDAIRNTGKYYCTWTTKAMQKTEAARLGENRCLTPLSDNRRLNKENKS